MSFEIHNVNDLLRKNKFDTDPVRARWAKTPEITAGWDMPADRVEDMTQDIKGKYGDDAMKSFVELMADLALNTPEFGEPIMIRAVGDLAYCQWEYQDGIRNFSEHMLPPSVRKPEFKDDAAKAVSRQWFYKGYLSKHLDEMSPDMSTKVQTFFGAKPQALNA